MGKKDISSVKNWKKGFRGTALWYVTSTHWATAVFRRAVCQPYFCVIWELLFCIPLNTIRLKKISTAKCEKEAFWETYLWSVNSSLRVSAFPSRRLSVRLFLGTLQSDIWKPIEGYGEKEISSDKNRKEAFWETALCSVNSSHRVTAFPTRIRSLRLFLRNLQNDISQPKEG